MKERVDTVLTDLGYFETKSKAQAAIMAGDVKINGQVIGKAGTLIDTEGKYDIEVKSMPFVSRGGYKLEKAIKTFGITLEGITCLDAGSSTGGFTDCMLQNGASKVYAIDVGYGQTAWKLQTDKRVKLAERTNIRNCTKEDIYDESDRLPSFATADLSFISVKKVLTNLIRLMRDDNIKLVILIKPQFEAGRKDIGKNGVVRDKSVHFDVIRSILEFAEENELYTIDLTYSPIKGPAGNIEYLAYFSDSPEGMREFSIQNIIEAAFAE